MTTLTITRKKASFLMAPARIILDGELQQNLKNGASANFDVAVGTHTIQIKTVYGAKTEERTVEVFEGSGAQVLISKSPRYMKYYWTHVYPIVIPAMIVACLGSILQSFLIMLIGLAVLGFGYVFIIKANTMLFDIEQV